MNILGEILVEKYLAGECTEVELEQIFQWLNVSEENRQEWMKLRMISAKSNYNHFADTEHIARSYKELRKDRIAQKRHEQEITRKITLRFIRYAACVLVLIGLSLTFYKYITDWQFTRMLVVEVAGNGQVQQVVLEDSSRIWVSAGSRIEYPERFGHKERTVLVEGKVYFEIAKDTKRPFYVNTETFSVKVLGTSFEVNSFKDKQTSDVILMEGKVEILDLTKATLCLMQPGQQFEFDKKNNQFTLHEVDAAMYASWHGGKLEFDGQTFAEIAKVLERHYNVRIVLDEGIARDKKLVGSLSFQKDIHEMMKTIELVLPIKYEVQTDIVVYIQSKK